MSHSNSKVRSCGPVLPGRTSQLFRQGVLVHLALFLTYTPAKPERANTTYATYGLISQCSWSVQLEGAPHSHCRGPPHPSRECCRTASRRRSRRRAARGTTCQRIGVVSESDKLESRHGRLYLRRGGMNVAALPAVPRRPVGQVCRLPPNTGDG
ncbi:hypothetical protein C8Q78DRAFT_27053 [Trametes maxima]|nr:hypothetical protein C8Q78DRAFT_27053 [Trametes maxima]